MEWFIVTNIHTLFTLNISVEMWMGQSIKTVLSFLPPVPVSRCVVYLASVSVSGRTLDLSPRENLIVDVTFRLWQVLGNQWTMAGGWASGQRSLPPNWSKGFSILIIMHILHIDSDTFLGREQWWDHLQQVTKQPSPRLPVTACCCSDWCRYWCQSFYLSYNIQIFNFSQLERISLLNCW